MIKLDTVAIALVANQRGEMLMLHRYRFAVDQWGMNCWANWWRPRRSQRRPRSGAGEKKSGWRPAGEATHLASYEPMPGIVQARTDVFMWRGAEHVGEPTDAEEAGRLECRAGTIIAAQAYLLSIATDGSRTGRD